MAVTQCIGYAGYVNSDSHVVMTSSSECSTKRNEQLAYKPALMLCAKHFNAIFRAYVLSTHA